MMCSHHTYFPMGKLSLGKWGSSMLWQGKIREGGYTYPPLSTFSPTYVYSKNWGSGEVRLSGGDFV